MSLCFRTLHLPRSLWHGQTLANGPLAHLLIFKVVCVAALLLAVFPSLAANSAFPDFPPSPPASTGTYSAKLPEYSMVSSSVVTPPLKTNVVADNSVKLPAYSMAASTPAVAKPPMDVKTMPQTSTEPVETNAVSNTSTNPMDVLNNDYRLAPGDTVDYQVLEDKMDPNENGDAQPIVVTDSGDIEIPFVGRYPAAGKTCLELARQLKGELEKKYYYQATVIISVKSMTSKGVIYVMGGVRTPGPQELPRDEILTVSKAILRAGGFDDFADQKHVQVTRKESGTNAVFTVNVSAVLDKSKVEQDRDAQPGDFIYVPEKTFRY
jgi:polysaccharide export outer membrane protein